MSRELLKAIETVELWVDMWEDAIADEIANDGDLEMIADEREVVRAMRLVLKAAQPSASEKK